MPVGYTPIFRIEQEGIDITSRFNDRLVSIEVTLGSGGGEQDKCEIVLDDREWKIAAPTVGRKLEIYLGYKEVGLGQQNVFEISTVEYLWPPKSIKITGNAAGMIGGLKVRKVKEFEGKTLGDIIGDIAKTGGVEPMVEVGLAETVVPFLNQTQSSFHLLQELERRYGAIAKFENGKLIFVPREGNETAGGLTLPILLLKPEHFARGSVRHNQRGAYSSVRAAYMDPDTHQPVWLETPNKFAPTDENGKPIDAPFRMPAPQRTKEEALKWMRATLETLRRSMGEANFELSKGDPWIRANQRILVAGMREGVNGDYLAETVVHTYTKGAGLTTKIVGKPPGDDAIDVLSEAISEQALDAGKQLQSPTPGRKLGVPYSAPVFDAT